MTVTFDLLAENWIPVIQNGDTREVNLKEVLCSAHEMSELSDPLPIVEFGLYRLLVALVMDIYQFQDSGDLEDLLDAGRFDEKRVDDYFRQWGHCFDLFDPKRPFLQAPGMDAFPERPLSGLLPPIPSGTASTLFHHFNESDFAVSPAVAARLLTTMAPFMTAGGAGLAPSINGAPPWYVLINGENLFQTICLNCFVGDLGLRGDAPPAWRNPTPPKTDGRCTKTSLSEALTWRPRQVQLVPSARGVCSISGVEDRLVVRTMKFRAGASCDFAWTDPSVPYKVTEKGPLVLRPQDGKEIWRDTGPLTLLNDKAYGSSEAKVKFARPLLVEQFEQLVIDQRIPKDTPLSATVYGMRTDMKMKVFEWRKEHLRVPGPMVVGSGFALFAQDAIENAGSAEYALKKAIKHLYPRDGAGNPKAFDSLIGNATRQYWGDLHSSYDDMLEDLARAPRGERDAAKQAAHELWAKRVREVALGIFHATSADMDAHGEDMQRRAEAEQRLYFALTGIFETPEQRDARKRKTKGTKTSTEGGNY